MQNSSKNQFKKYAVAAVSVLLFFVLLLGVLFAMPPQIMQKASAATDFTQATASEQAEINRKMLADWGNPSTSQLQVLKNGATNNDINITTGDYWYYLTSDIKTTIEILPYLKPQGHVRVLLNGYTISGRFHYEISSNSSSGYKPKLSIFDRIPNANGVGFRTGTGYNYKPNSTGSTITEDVKIDAGNNATINAYGITFSAFGLGRIACLMASGAVEGGVVNAYQCAVKNSTELVYCGGGVVVSHNGRVNLEYCNIYNNQSMYAGIETPDGNSISDIFFSAYYSTGILTAYKSNIGVIHDGASDIRATKAVYCKDVDFGQKITVTRATIDTFFQSMNNIKGTIELVYGSDFTYTGSNPNLNLIVRGRDSKEDPISGYNKGTIANGARVNTIIVGGTGQIDNGATVGQVIHNGVNGRLIDNRQSPAVDKGIALSTNKVIINSGATVSTLDIWSGTGSAADINSSPITATVASGSYVYNGSAHTPAVTVLNSGTLLVKDTDYRVGYRNNINAGTATITITGMGNYSGTRTLSFTITKATAPNLGITQLNVTQFGTTLGQYASQLPSGWTWQTASSTVIDETVKSVVAVYNGSDKGNYENLTATVIINYTAQNPNDNFATSSTITVTVASGSYVYNGMPHTPAVTVLNSGTPLVNGTEYTLGYSNNINAGTASIVVTGVGKYYGSRTVTFVIARAFAPSLSLTQLNVTQFGTTLSAYNGYLPSGWAWQEPNKVIDATVTSVVAVYNGADKGNYENLAVTVAVHYAVQDPNNNFATSSLIGVELEYYSYEYTGMAITPKVTVTKNNVPLISGVDYSVSYSNNIAIGTGYVTVVGMGSYYGSKTVNFMIVERSLTDFRIYVAAAEYTGKAVTPQVSVMNSNNSMVLMDGVDYTLSYSENVNIGRGRVRVTGIGNYKGIKDGTFDIVARDVTGIVVTVGDMEYTGTALQPTVTVQHGNLLLVIGTDYTVSYSNNINAGIASAIITGKGNYTGTRIANFTILARNMGNARVVVENATYTGGAVRPTVRVIVNGIQLTESDYIVNYNNNVNVGTGTVIIEGRGNYTGTVAANFSILAGSGANGAIGATAAGSDTRRIIVVSMTIVGVILLLLLILIIVLLLLKKRKEEREAQERRLANYRMQNAVYNQAMNPYNMYPNNQVQNMGYQPQQQLQQPQRPQTPNNRYNPYNRNR